MTKMKNKITLLFGCILLLSVFTSCEQIAKDNTGRILPNGYVLSQNEEDALFAFAIEKGYIEPTSLNFDDYSAGDNQPNIDEMIAAMKERFGDIAENYYWEEDITEQYYVGFNNNTLITPNSNSRATIKGNIEIPLRSPYDEDFEAKISYTIISHTGLWWTYIEFNIIPLIREKSVLIDKEWYKFKVAAANIIYEDDVNHIERHVTYNDLNPEYDYETKYYNTGYDLKMILEEEIKNTRDIRIIGDSKNGWRPKMKKIYAEINYEHFAISHGGTDLFFWFSYTQK